MLKISPVPGSRRMFAATALAVLLAFSAVNASASAVANDSAALPDTYSTSSLPSAPTPIAQDASTAPSTFKGRLRSHIALEAGGGMSFPSSAINAWNTTGYNATAGAGWMFSPHFGALLEYQYLTNGLTNYALQGLSAGDCYPQGTICASGNVRINGISVAPIVDLAPESKYDAYFTLGLGSYHKTTNTSQTNTADVTTSASYSVTRFGYNFGMGLTRKAGWNSHVKYFVETRFLRIDTSMHYGVNMNSVGRTSLVPVTIGLRY